MRNVDAVTLFGLDLQRYDLILVLWYLASSEPLKNIQEKSRLRVQLSSNVVCDVKMWVFVFYYC